jgi:hypothetical protein
MVTEISEEVATATRRIPIREHGPAQGAKTIYTLAVGDYDRRITDLTFPLMRNYAAKIGARIQIIEERRFPSRWPITIEKFQVPGLAKANGDEWSIFFDADTLVSPEFFDPTEHMRRDQVAHNGKDMAGVRWKIDDYFRRDGRFFGSCTWCVIASSWTVDDLWRFPEGDPEDSYDRINITITEHNSGQCKREHLIDDYTLSRNIARYGLKATTLIDICGDLGWKAPDGRGANPFLFHLYTISVEEKLRRMLLLLSTPQQVLVQDPRNPQGPPIGVGWGLISPQEAERMRQMWKVPK